MSSVMQQKAPPSSYDHLYVKPSEEAKKSGTASTGYEPNAFDLITPSHDGQALTTKLIPSIFLEAEAVESAGLLGEGASFVASLQKTPKGSEVIETKTFMVTYTVTKTRPGPSRPRFVVYKTARVRFDMQGEPIPEHRGV